MVLERFYDVEVKLEYVYSSHPFGYSELDWNLVFYGFSIGIKKESFMGTKPLSCIYGDPLRMKYLMSHPCFDKIMAKLCLTDKITTSLHYKFCEVRQYHSP